LYAARNRPLRRNCFSRPDDTAQTRDGKTEDKKIAEDRRMGLENVAKDYRNDC